MKFARLLETNRKGVMFVLIVLAKESRPQFIKVVLLLCYFPALSFSIHHLIVLYHLFLDLSSSSPLPLKITMMIHIYYDVLFDEPAHNQTTPSQVKSREYTKYALKTIQLSL